MTAPNRFTPAEPRDGSTAWAARRIAELESIIADALREGDEAEMRVILRKAWRETE